MSLSITVGAEAAELPDLQHLNTPCRAVPAPVTGERPPLIVSKDLASPQIPSAPTLWNPSNTISSPNSPRKTNWTPTELLLHIVSFLEPGSPALLRFALVSRQFYAVALPQFLKRLNVSCLLGRNNKELGKRGDMDLGARLFRQFVGTHASCQTKDSKFRLIKELVCDGDGATDLVLLSLCPRIEKLAWSVGLSLLPEVLKRNHLRLAGLEVTYSSGFAEDLDMDIFLESLKGIQTLSTLRHVAFVRIGDQHNSVNHSNGPRRTSNTILPTLINSITTNAPNLDSLFYSGCRRKQELAACLTAQSVTKLAIHFILEEGDHDRESIQDLSHVNLPHLQQLSIHGGFYPRLLNTFSSACPNLEAINVHLTPFGDDLAVLDLSVVAKIRECNPPSGFLDSLRKLLQLPEFQPTKITEEQGVDYGEDLDSLWQLMCTKASLKEIDFIEMRTESLLGGLPVNLKKLTIDTVGYSLSSAEQLDNMGSLLKSRPELKVEFGNVYGVGVKSSTPDERKWYAEDCFWGKWLDA